MKRICIITQCTLPVPTSKGGAVETLAEYMLDENELNPRYHFTVITVKDERAIQMSGKYKYADFVYINENPIYPVDKLWNLSYRILKHLGVYIPFSRTFLCALRKIKQLRKYDLYLYLAGPTTQIPLLAKIVDKERLLVHLHWDGMGTPRYASSCKRVIAISKYIAGQWKKEAGSSAVDIVENCVRLSMFNNAVSEKEKDSLRNKLGISKQDKVVLYVGRIVEAKGIRELIKAYESIKQDNTVLLIIGSSNFGAKTNTPYEKEVAALISKAKKRIVFTGYIHQSELYKYYALATCSVMPSQFQEPAGLVAIEAQATGTPLIATHVGGLGEYCSPGASIIVEKDNDQVEHIKEAIELLLDNPEKCEEMGKCGKKFADNFSTKKYFDDFSKVFDSSILEVENRKN